MSELSAIKARQQQTWETGDFAMVGLNAMLVSELLCEAVDLRAGQTVLDVATGSGNTALTAARHWCEVTGNDYAPTLLARARERAAAERIPVTFQDGDAENLPFPDHSFDLVLSTFGVMFAPDQTTAANELLRVCRPGGKIGLANWTPDGFVGQSGQITAQYTPLPSQVLPPTRWGTKKGLRILLGEAVTSLHITRRTTTFRYQSMQHYLDFYRTYFGPMIRAFEGLGAEEQEHLQDALLVNVVHFNRSGDETMAVPAEYLEVVAVKR
jgi:ubiquinone/menaquinone biosynthesis C-methylase UbiE